MHCGYELVLQEIALIVRNTSCGERRPVAPAFQNVASHGSPYSIVDFFSNLTVDTLVASQCLQLSDYIVAAAHLGAAKQLTDVAALAAYCGAYALWAKTTEAIQKYGTMVKSPTGYPIQSPYVSIANRQAEIMMQIASEFGFTPASRSRISTPTKNEPLWWLKRRICV